MGFGLHFVFTLVMCLLAFSLAMLVKVSSDTPCKSLYVSGVYEQGHGCQHARCLGVYSVQRTYPGEVSAVGTVHSCSTGCASATLHLIQLACLYKQQGTGCDLDCYDCPDCSKPGEGCVSISAIIYRPGSHLTVGRDEIFFLFLLPCHDRLLCMTCTVVRTLSLLPPLPHPLSPMQASCP